MRLRAVIVILAISLLTGCESRVVEDPSLTEFVSEFNKKCPRKVDEETQLDGIEIAKPNTIIYKFTLVNLVAENADTAAFRKAVWPGLLSMIKLSPEMKALRDEGTIFHYRYTDKNHHPISFIKIYPSDYQP